MPRQLSDNEALAEIWAVIGDNEPISENNDAIVDKVSALQSEVEGYRLAHGKQLSLASTYDESEARRGRYPDPTECGR